MTTAPDMPLDPLAFHPGRPPVEVQGYKLILDPTLVDHHEDWSKVRSPGRAKRRERRGHRQRIRRWTTPMMDVKAFAPGPRAQFPPQMFMHPARWPSFSLELAEGQDFLDRAERLSLDVKKALDVQKQWRWMAERGGRETLIRERWLRVDLDIGKLPASGPLAASVPRQTTYRVETIEALPICRFGHEGYAAVWNGLVLGLLWL